MNGQLKTTGGTSISDDELETSESEDELETGTSESEDELGPVD